MKPEDITKDNNSAELLAAYRKDKQREAQLYIWLGILFIAWTVFDVITGFFEEMWYINIFFGLLGLAMLIHGLMQSRAHKQKDEVKKQQ